MQGGFVLAPLHAGRISQAYPLVREVVHEATLGGWQAYARAMLRTSSTDKRGILAASSENDYLRGLFVYRIGPDLTHGRVLIIDCFVVSSLFSPKDVAAALIEGAEAVARRHRCGAVRAEFAAGPAWLRDILGAQGYGPCPCRLQKSLDAAHGPGSDPSPGGHTAR
ncbi:MAG: hypothetical protein ACE5H8_04040 [Alphaproteobacteria bacterium]